MQIDALSVQCPLCDTHAGNQCINGNWQELNGPHPQRERFAEAMAKSSERPTERKALRDYAHHNVYVVELDAAVRTNKKFLAANPNCRADKPCLYVGVTGLTPEKRFENHKAGVKSSSIVKKYGVRLRPKCYSRYNPMTYEDAANKEIKLAERLRARGFAVWQN